MKVGDLVRHSPAGLVGTRAGLVVEIIQKKCWRTSELGPKINWESVEPEPHAIVMYPGEANIITIPVVDLEVF